MSIQLTADHVAVAIVAAAKACGDDPAAAMSATKTNLRRCLAPAAGALSDYTDAPQGRICALMGVPDRTVSNAKSRSPVFWPAYHATFIALEDRFGPPATKESGRSGRPLSLAPPKALTGPVAKEPKALPAPIEPQAGLDRDQENKLITKYWTEDGLTIPQIMARLPGRTKGSISSFITNNLGVGTGNPANRTAGGRRKASSVDGVVEAPRAPRPVARPRKAEVIQLRPRPVREPTAPVPAAEEVEGQVGRYWPPGPKAVELMSLEPNCCRSVGGVTGAAQLFCAEITESEDAPYCSVHTRAASSANLSGAEWDRRYLKRVPA